MLEIKVMKANAIAAILLIAAAIHADARFAWPYPRKAVSPAESGALIMINGDACSPTAESDPDRRRTVAKQASRGQLKTGMFHSASASAPLSDVAVGFVVVLFR
jgi:hypothetical protein